MMALDEWCLLVRHNSHGIHTLLFVFCRPYGQNTPYLTLEPQAATGTTGLQQGLQPDVRQPQ